MKIRTYLRFFALLVAMGTLICVFGPRTGRADMATYSDDWTAWDQEQSADSTMRAYGCWVVAQARLLCASGFESSASFNPDIYLAWEREHDEIDSGFYQTDSSGVAPIRYAAQYSDSKGMELCSVTPEGSTYKEKIWNSVNQGYFVIVQYSTGSATGHYVMINNGASSAQGRLICYPSGGMASNDVNDKTFTGIWVYKVNYLQYTVTFDPNGGTGSLKSFTKSWLDTLTITPSLVSFRKTGFFIDHFSTQPDDSGDKYYLWDEIHGLNATLYAIWLEAIPPELVGDVYAKDIAFDRFTLTFKATDNVGVTGVQAEIAPYLVPNNKKRVWGTYDTGTQTASIPINLNSLHFRTDLYILKLYIYDAAGNKCTVEIINPYSPYIINTDDKGIWKAKYDKVKTYASPTASGTFNGISQIKRTVAEGTKFDMLGSMEAGGVTWLRIGATNEFVKKSDFQYDTISNLWNSIASTFVWVLGGENVYAVDAPYGSIRLTGTQTGSAGSPSERPYGGVTTDPSDDNPDNPSSGETHGIAINSQNFPDSVFRAYVSDHFDLNQNGYLSAAETAAVTVIDLTRNHYVYSLQGVAFFANLETLDCSAQHLSSLDLTQNPALVTLNCSGNNNMTLDISQNFALAWLDASSINLQSLDLTSNNALEVVCCEKQGAAAITLGSCPVLRELYCGDNGLTALDVSGCPALEILSCFENKLPSLNVASNHRLLDLNCGSNPSLSALDLSQCPLLERLECGWVNLASLDLRPNTELTYLDCSVNARLTNVNVNGCPRLQEFYCNSCALPRIDVTNNPSLNEFWCNHNALIALDLSRNAKLGHLYCVGNQLTSLDVTHNPELWGLSCGDNLLTALDLSRNPLLRDLSCYGNQITYLDLSQNASLEGLRVYSNRLTSLDLTHNPSLEYVWADDNGIEVSSMVNLDTLPGFDISRISNVTGGFLVGHHVYLTETTARYDYQCNAQYTVNFSFTGTPAQTTASGQCGPNVFWMLYDNGFLSIYGEGGMYDYAFSEAPWYPYRNQILNAGVGSGVTSIGNTAFYECEKMQEISIASTVTVIGSGAFLRASGLSQVTLPENLTEIGDYAFENCTGLETIWIPKSVTSISSNAFWLCSGLKTIFVDDQNPAYASMKGILFNKDKTTLLLCPAAIPYQTYSIPDTVTAIAKRAFYGNTTLTEVLIPDGVTVIPDNAFTDCKALEKMSIPDQITDISWAAFSECVRLQSLTIGSGVTRIQNYAFSSCSSLKSVFIPANVTWLGDTVFQFCTALTEITVSPQNGSYASEWGVLFNKDKTELIAYPIGKTDERYVIPESVVVIADRAFAYCKTLTSVYIHTTLEHIGMSAFDIMSLAFTDVYYGGSEAQWNAISNDGGNSSLDSATIHFHEIPFTPNLRLPGKLVRVETGAFVGLPTGTVVYIPSTVRTIQEGAFDQGIVIVTPAGSYAAGWAKENRFRVYEEQAY